MIVVCEMHTCLLGDLEACPPRKILNLYTSQIASDTIWDKISKHFDDTYRSLVKKGPLTKEHPHPTFGPISCIVVRRTSTKNGEGLV